MAADRTAATKRKLLCEPTDIPWPNSQHLQVAVHKMRRRFNMKANKELEKKAP